MVIDYTIRLYPEIEYDPSYINLAVDIILPGKERIGVRQQISRWDVECTYGNALKLGIEAFTEEISRAISREIKQTIITENNKAKHKEQ